jgi:hypothetical protein
MSTIPTSRLSKQAEPGLFSLVIFPVRSSSKLTFLFIWIVLWTFCGLVFIISWFNYSQGPDYARVEYAAIEQKIKDPQEKKKAITELSRKIEQNRNQRLFLLVLIGFWCYYEFKVVRAYFYRKFGYEKIWIKNGSLFYRRDIFGKGRVRKFDVEFVDSIERIEFNEQNFFESMSRSFWSLSGENLQFSYHSKVMRFGIQLEKNEMKEAADFLNKALKEIKRS